jgi:membrane fusion protein, adhesin transport system
VPLVATPFRYTIRAIERGRWQPWLVLAGAACLIGVWMIWFALAELPISEISIGGRIESDAEARPIEASVSGTVVAHQLHVGEAVVAGAPLLELDATALGLELEEHDLRLAALESDRATLERIFEAEQALLAELERDGRIAVREARTSMQGARADADFARLEAARASSLNEEGSSSDSELARAETVAATAGASLDAVRVRVDRVRSTGRLQLEERRIRLSELEQARVAAVGALKVERSAIARLRHEIERRTVRAPLAGVIGSVGTARVGSFVHQGDTIAVLVPDGILRVVASFPSSAAGRLAPGQAVVLRFPAFPWTAYGSRRGRVARVASEPQGHVLRVDIDLAPDAGSAIPLAHGMELVAEVATETISPARLLLRHAGALFDDPREPAR